jgi:ankyrin repeat protein
MNRLKKIAIAFLILNHANIALYAEMDPSGFKEAIHAGNAVNVKRYIDERFDVNSGDYLTVAAEKGYVEIVELLLKAGAAVNNVKEKINRPLSRSEELTIQDPLIRAVRYPTIVTMLIGAGANLNATDREGNTPLIKALRVKAIPTVKILIDSGADINIIDNTGSNALLLAAMNGELLISNKEIIKSLLSRGANPNIKDKSGNIIPFFLVAEVGDIELVNDFINAGVDINIIDNKGRSALIAVVEKTSPSLSPSQMGKLIAVIRRLIEAGINQNIKDVLGRTAFQFANKPEIIELLSEKNPVPSKETKPASLNRSLKFSNHSEELVVLTIPNSPTAYERKTVPPSEDVVAMVLSEVLPIYIDTKSGQFLLKSSADGQSFTVYKFEAPEIGRKDWKEYRKDIQQLPVEQAEKVVVIINPDGSVTVAQRQ